MQPLNFSVPESAPAMRARELLLSLRETFAVRLAAFAEAEGRAGQHAVATGHSSRPLMPGLIGAMSYSGTQSQVGFLRKQYSMKSIDQT